MGLIDLKDEIINEANKNADELLKKAEGEAKEIAKKAEQEAKELHNKAEQEAEDEIVQLGKKEIASATLEARRIIFDKKKGLIGEVFESARKNLASLPKVQKQAIINSLLKKAAKEIDIATVYCSKQDKALVNGTFAVLEEEISGGIIAENSDGTVRIDHSYDTLLDTIKESNLQDIASSLFE